MTPTGFSILVTVFLLIWLAIGLKNVTHLLITKAHVYWYARKRAQKREGKRYERF